MTTAMTNAKKQAILDIREELAKLNKTFISFKESLDDVVEALVNKEEEQRLPRVEGPHKSWCVNAWTVKEKGN